MPENKRKTSSDAIASLEEAYKRLAEKYKIVIKTLDLIGSKLTEIQKIIPETISELMEL
ncbi:hypothetical protein LCGC14_0224540 [marine sediment metagenome]|uniref:Uncharacterized protein n=1 Tax=marine sediment metagenome TaxID=412755 RepID=A0A0F9UCG8_9ZZZZ